MQYDLNNIFAKILRNEIEVKKIYEDDLLLAFPDINPIAETHVIVIPKKPYVCYSDFVQKASSEEIASFFQTLDQIAKNITNNQDYKLITNNGPKAGQTVFHFHCHVIAGKMNGKTLA